MKAVINIDKIKTHFVRKYAEENFKDTVAAKKYLTYYENMLKYGKVA
jgi:hypothetical protein